MNLNIVLNGNITAKSIKSQVWNLTEIKFFKNILSTMLVVSNAITNASQVSRNI